MVGSLAQPGRTESRCRRSKQVLGGAACQEVGAQLDVDGMVPSDWYASTISPRRARGPHKDHLVEREQGPALVRHASGNSPRPRAPPRATFADVGAHHRRDELRHDAPNATSSGLALISAANPRAPTDPATPFLPAEAAFVHVRMNVDGALIRSKAAPAGSLPGTWSTEHNRCAKRLQRGGSRA
jgi:hypothetical protein